MSGEWMFRFRSPSKETSEVFPWEHPSSSWLFLRNTLPVSNSSRNRFCTLEIYVFCDNFFNIYIRERGVPAVSKAPPCGYFIAMAGVSLTPPETAGTPETGTKNLLYKGDW